MVDIPIIYPKPAQFSNIAPRSTLRPSAVTAAIVAVNGLIAEAFIEGRRKKEEGRRKNWIDYILPASLCLVLHIVGWSLYNRPLNQEAATALKIGIIQGNIPNEIKFDSGGWGRALEGYTNGYKQLADRKVDAVLLPETALPFIWTNEYQRSTLSFYQAILERGVVAWVGGFGQQEIVSLAAYWRSIAQEKLSAATINKS